MLQVVVCREKPMQSILIEHPHRTTEQAKPLPEKTQWHQMLEGLTAAG